MKKGCRFGKVYYQGAAINFRAKFLSAEQKNAAVAILPAAILSDEPCIIENVPSISDIDVTIKILLSMGAEVTLINRFYP